MSILFQISFCAGQDLVPEGFPGLQVAEQLAGLLAHLPSRSLQNIKSLQQYGVKVVERNFINFVQKSLFKGLSRANHASADLSLLGI
jgi:hypothetical protein